MNEYERIQHARKNAQEAAREGKGVEANPYEEGKYLHLFWLANYCAALQEISAITEVCKEAA